MRSVDIEHTLVIEEVAFFVEVDRAQRRVNAMRIDHPRTYAAYFSVPGHRAGGMTMIVLVAAE